MVLLLTNRWDLSADFVVRGLRDREVPFFRLNAEDLRSGQATLRLPEVSMRVATHGQEYDLSKVRAVWNRRPGKPFDETPPEDRPSQAVQLFVAEQWFAWLEALELIPGVVWVNEPRAGMAMESKPRQLALANRIGFSVPETCVTNSAQEAYRFAELHGGRVVAKALYKPLLEEPDGDSFVFANVVDTDDLADVEALRLAPLILQPVLSPKEDYRVTVVGDTVLSARLVRGVGGPVDWRRDRSDVRFVLEDLPEELTDQCRRFVREAGLRFGAIDLVLYQGRYFFLEINPNGEWGWLQKPHGIPIAEALCDLLGDACTVRTDG